MKLSDELVKRLAEECRDAYSEIVCDENGELRTKELTVLQMWQAFVLSLPQILSDLGLEIVESKELVAIEEAGCEICNRECPKDAQLNCRFLNLTTKAQGLEPKKTPVEIKEQPSSCPDCHGKGTTYGFSDSTNAVCPICNGKGVVE